eukprot:8700062-Lingulodinium_polyedra.AAC.1
MGGRPSASRRSVRKCGEPVTRETATAVVSPRLVPWAVFGAGTLGVWMSRAVAVASSLLGTWPWSML